MNARILEITTCSSCPAMRYRHGYKRPFLVVTCTQVGRDILKTDDRHRGAKQVPIPSWCPLPSPAPITKRPRKESTRRSRSPATPADASETGKAPPGPVRAAPGSLWKCGKCGAENKGGRSACYQCQSNLCSDCGRFIGLNRCRFCDDPLCGRCTADHERNCD